MSNQTSSATPKFVSKPELPKRRMTTRICADGVRRGGFAAKTQAEYERDFWLRVNKAGPDDCWYWTGATRLMGNKNGGRYGVASFNGKQTAAHRVSFMIANELVAIPSDKEILHRCNNGICVNPSHLLLGSHRENMAQASRDGLLPTGDQSGSRLHPESRPRGTDHPHAKITEADIAEIFRLRHAGMTEKTISKKFGIKDVSSILNRTSWPHVEIPAKYILNASAAKALHQKNNGLAHKKATDDQVRLARMLCERDGVKPAHIAKEFRWSSTLAWEIVRRKKYIDVLDARPAAQRTAPRVNVLRGYFGNEPMGRSYSAPVTAGVTILSGQLISLVSGAWVLGVASGAEPFIAFADSTDTDVISSGLLLGLSCAGQYEIETAWFDNTKTYSESSFLSPGTGTTYGSVANSTPGQNNVGAITIATSNTDVIGYAVAGGRQDATAINSQSGYLSIADSASTAPGVPISGGGPPPTTGALSRIYLLRFRTQWLPHVEVAS